MSEPGWDAFEAMNEADQARFLLDVAERGLPGMQAHAEVQGKVAAYLQTGRAVLAGDSSLHAELTRFLNDPSLREDFGAYFAELNADERACAALDLASYACGFVARVTAPAAGVKDMPDPVLEALPYLADHYRKRAELLGL